MRETLPLDQFIIIQRLATGRYHSQGTLTNSISQSPTILYAPEPYKKEKERQKNRPQN